MFEQQMSAFWNVTFFIENHERTRKKGPKYEQEKWGVQKGRSFKKLARKNETKIFIYI